MDNLLRLTKLLKIDIRGNIALRCERKQRSLILGISDDVWDLRHFTRAEETMRRV